MMAAGTGHCPANRWRLPPRVSMNCNAGPPKKTNGKRTSVKVTVSPADGSEDTQ